MLPLGGLGLGDGFIHVQAPPVIKEYYVNFWWFLMVLFATVCVCEVVAVEIFDAIFTAILALIVWHMAKENCAQMSPHCLIMFGIVCAIQAIFGVLTLVGSLKGRRTAHTTRAPLDGDKMTYTMTVEMHPFFDQSMGFLYNMQSVVKILSPAAMVLGALLTYMSYKAFPSIDEEMTPVMAGGGDLYGGAGRADLRSYLGSPHGTGAASGRAAGGNRSHAHPQPAFQGSAHRLGAPAKPSSATLPQQYPSPEMGINSAGAVIGGGAGTPPSSTQEPQAPRATQDLCAPVALEAPVAAGGLFRGAGQRLGSS